MRAQDVEAGVEYAVGSPSRYDPGKCSRMRVVTPRVRLRRSVAHEVEVIETGGYGSRPVHVDGKLYVTSAQIREKWEDYGPKRDAHLAEQQARREKDARLAAVASDVEARCMALGIETRKRRDGFVTFDPDEALGLVELAERAR